MGGDASAWVPGPKENTPVRPFASWHGVIDRQTDRQTDSHRQTDAQTDAQTETLTEAQRVVTATTVDAVQPRRERTSTCATTPLIKMFSVGVTHSLHITHAAARGRRGLGDGVGVANSATSPTVVLCRQDDSGQVRLRGLCIG